jgi:hypothetical protein
MDPTNSIVWTRKGFIGSLVMSCRVGFHQNLGQKVSDGSQLSAQNVLANNSHRDITNRNQPLSFFHMDTTNSIVSTRKSFIGSVLLCVVQGWFSAKLGSKNQ